MNEPTTKADAQSNLERLKAVQSESDGLLILAREDTKICLDAMLRSIYCELQYLDEKGDVADGELQNSWSFLQESVTRLRRAQGAVKIITSQIEDATADLADGELWLEELKTLPDSSVTGK